MQSYVMQTHSCTLGHATNMLQNAGTANALVGYLQLYQVMKACTQQSAQIYDKETGAERLPSHLGASSWQTSSAAGARQKRRWAWGVFWAGP